MPSPITPNQFCEAVPSANADLCTRLTRFFNIAQYLCDHFGWMLNSDGSLSSEFLSEVAATVVPTGVVVYAAGSDLGSGWLLCDGSQVSRTTYANLFDVIGTRYGAGDGSTTFTLPDIRGRSPIGAGTGSQGGALTNRGIDTKYVGEESHTMTEQELVAHHHTFTGPSSRVNEKGDGANVVWSNSQDEDTQDTGGGDPFNVVHPSIILYAFIKV